jgi:hypothetical protein
LLLRRPFARIIRRIEAKRCELLGAAVENQFEATYVAAIMSADARSLFGRDVVDLNLARGAAPWHSERFG